MPSFPYMVDLPPILSTRGWTWEPIKTPWHPSHDFWLATDMDGNRWLTKLRGSFYAYREITFAKLAQAMGWSCQSSIYIKLDAESAAIVGAVAGEVHAAHWFLDEHPMSQCGECCGMHQLFDLKVRSVEDLEGIGIAHLNDWPKSQFAAYVFGANETSDMLFTAQHEFVIIDSEQMFSTGPCRFEELRWLHGQTGDAYRKGVALAAETCADIANLTSVELTRALAVPQGVKIDQRWSIAPKIKQSIKFASSYLQSRY
jgi:hypothetical protein